MMHLSRISWLAIPMAAALFVLVAFTGWSAKPVSADLCDESAIVVVPTGTDVDACSAPSINGVAVVAENDNAFFALAWAISRAETLNGGTISDVASVADNEDVLFVMYAGFIGAWGEWHTSKNFVDGPGGKDARKRVMDALLAAAPPTRRIALRYPAYKRMFFGTAATTDAQVAAGEATSVR